MRLHGTNFSRLTEIGSPHFEQVSLKAIARPVLQSQFCDLWLPSAAHAAEIRPS
jgi:hypothetical protein